MRTLFVYNAKFIRKLYPQSSQTFWIWCYYRSLVSVLYCSGIMQDRGKHYGNDWIQRLNKLNLFCFGLFLLGLFRLSGIAWKAIYFSNDALFSQVWIELDRWMGFMQICSFLNSSGSFHLGLKLIFLSNDLLYPGTFCIIYF